MGTGNYDGSYLVVGHKDELEDKENANDSGPGVMETKTGEHVFLLQEEGKEHQRQQEVELQTRGGGSGWTDHTHREGT